jgi:glucose/arabinose dehydrogenase
MRFSTLITAISPVVLGLASCGSAPAGDNRTTRQGASDFTVREIARFEEPWAMAFLPGTPFALVTERKGRLKLWQEDGPVREVDGVPAVDYGGQGGLGDVVFAPDYATSRAIYLSWAEAGPAGTRGAAVGRAKLVCEEHDSCRLDGLRVIWRQAPKVTGRGHYSHRLAFSPDGQYLFVSSGERQKFTPAQDLSVNLGKILRLLQDGSPAPGNPFADRGGVAAQVWTYGHRNVLGLDFDAQGRLWDLEHGPAGGDELNLVEPGRNYGWPLASNGDNYDGTPIPRHATRPDLAAPAISWNPVIAPGDFIFYSGDLFPAWKGQALIAGMVYPGLVRVAIDGTEAREVDRIDLGKRIREIEQGPDGAIWILEDKEGGRLRKIVPKR